MARTKAALGAGARLADYLSASLLARVFPAEEVHAVLDAHGCNSQRLRSFPAVAGVYYCMALSLYPEAAYEEVFAAVAQGLAWAAGAADPQRVAKSSISGVRSKIGAAPLRDLVERCCVALADARTHPQAFYRGLRLVAVDGSNFELPDEADNVQQFGRPGSRTGMAGYPQAQCAVLVECATHAILGANIGAYRASEWEVCQPLMSRLQPGMLCLADRGFNGYEYWRQARASGADLLWRCAANRQLPVHQLLEDGSYISAIYPTGVGRVQAQEQAMVVRVIEYALPNDAAGQPRYRLLTTLLDARAAPALELAALYHQRWEIEAVFDELKTHLRQSRRVLRSKTAELVRQEFYGWVLAHYAVRWLLHQGAARHRIPHEELSFTGHVQLLRRAQPRSGAFPPRAAPPSPPLVQ
ncbi:MAG: IS4 family transposase [Phenylobacterium sp.]|uniref:IS4 family transposase n=1 Tax=Phenylobacterium sp. TaxID=1871053 RepID=UPI0011FE283F|nr:IS4 family transposase [Phenylobacterium sp.]TAL28218.1 MAG: IS4 family transposase [Phenylobacterium sp.]